MPSQQRARISFESGQLLEEKYLIEELIGQGGMGRIYAARQRPFDRRVALKVLHPKHTDNDVLLERFFQEARAISQLSHPHTVTVHDYGRTDDGDLFIVMEFVDGCTLKSWRAKRGRLALEEAVTFTVQIAQSLGEAHQKGIIHRDLKPDNVMVCQAGGDPFIKVLDFGIAKLVEGPNQSLTQAGAIVGTPMYMAPEQAHGAKLDARADLYALGCLFFELLMGEPPFTGNSALEVLMKHRTEAVPSLDESYPARLSEFFARVMSKDPDGRPTDAHDFVVELFAHMAPAPEPSSPANDPPAPDPAEIGGAEETARDTMSRSNPSLERIRMRMRSTPGVPVTGERLPAEVPVDRPETLLAVGPYNSGGASLEEDTAAQEDAQRVEEPGRADAPGPTDEPRPADEPERAERTPGLEPPRPRRPVPREALHSPTRAAQTEPDSPPAVVACSNPALSFYQERAPAKLEASAYTLQGAQGAMTRAQTSTPQAPEAASPVSSRLDLQLGGVPGPRGPMTLRVSLDPERSGRATPEALEAPEATAAEGRCALSIQSEPPGGLVFIDGLPVGRAPLTYRAAAGASLDVRVELPGLEPFEVTSVRLRPDRDNRLFAPMRPEVLTLHIEAPLPGCELWVQGRLWGTLPARTPRALEVAWPEGPLRMHLRHPDHEELILEVPARALRPELRLAPPAEAFAARGQSGTS